MSAPWYQLVSSGWCRWYERCIITAWHMACSIMLHGASVARPLLHDTYCCVCAFLLLCGMVWSSEKCRRRRIEREFLGCVGVGGVCLWDVGWNLIPVIQNEPIVDQNCVLGQPLRPVRKRPGSRSRGAYEVSYEARSTWRHTPHATRNSRTEVGSSTRRHPVARR
jgi:hypothetical protein